ncbi:MAG: class I SAM-dependent methyltransferase [Candidatus Lokiarchaeota archaeon]
MKFNKNYILQSQLDLPFLETNRDHLERIFKVLNKKYGLKKQNNKKLIDLGAGNGRIIIFSALYYQIESVGIEIDMNLVSEGRENIKKLKKQKNIKKNVLKNIRIEHGDIYEQNLKDYDYIYLFSLPTMQKYMNHVFKTAKKGAIIIAYKYPLENFKFLEFKYKLELSIDPKIFTYFYKKM